MSFDVGYEFPLRAKTFHAAASINFRHEMFAVKVSDVIRHALKIHELIQIFVIVSRKVVKLLCANEAGASLSAFVLVSGQIPVVADFVQEVCAKKFFGNLSTVNGSVAVVTIFDRENFSRSGDDIHKPVDDVERTRVNIFQVAQVESRSLKILAAPLQL